eukprot:m.160299 g.160299  ORF g.160299 m.160299 type:complete len:105 (-) comp11925_c0_seq1:219-533(-)
MSGGGIGGRLAAWFANEVMAKQLSKSESFRKFVVRTHDTVEKVKTEAVKVSESDATKKLAEVAKQKVMETQKGGSTMFESLRKSWRQLDEEGRRLKDLQDKTKS